MFLNQRLGIVLSLSRANSYAEHYRVTHTYYRATTTADQRPLVLTAINFKDGPQFILKDTVTLSAPRWRRVFVFTIEEHLSLARAGLGAVDRGEQCPRRLAKFAG